MPPAVRRIMKYVTDPVLRRAIVRNIAPGGLMAINTNAEALSTSVMSAEAKRAGKSLHRSLPGAISRQSASPCTATITIRRMGYAGSREPPTIARARLSSPGSDASTKPWAQTMRNRKVTCTELHDCDAATPYRASLPPSRSCRSEKLFRLGDARLLDDAH